jgi:hypothetical protein
MTKIAIRYDQPYDTLGKVLNCDAMVMLTAPMPWKRQGYNQSYLTDAYSLRCQSAGQAYLSHSPKILLNKKLQINRLTKT